MANQLTTLGRQQQTLKFNLFYAVLLGLIASVFVMFGASAVLSAMSGQWLYFGLSTALLIYSVWALGASFISIPLVMHLNKKYGEKKYGELDVAHSRALKLVTRLPCRKTVDLPVLMSNLALMRLCQGNYESAEQLFRKATEYIAAEPRLNSTFAAGILEHNLGSACMRLGNLAEAEVHANKSIEIFELSKNRRWRIGLGLPNLLLGALHAKFGEYDVAEEHLETARHISETEKLPAGTIFTSFAQSKNQMFLWLSYVEIKQEKVAEAEASCDAAVELIAKDPSGANTLTLEILLMLANEFMNIKQFERAERLLEIAYAIGSDWPYHPDAKQVLNYFEKLLLLTDRQSEVADMRNWLRHVDHHMLLVQKLI
jgi:tetratricopeptide (TPR) repeat protein